MTRREQIDLEVRPVTYALCLATAELWSRSDFEGLLQLDQMVRAWLIKRYGKRANPELLFELDRHIGLLENHLARMEVAS
jgi:hypothetical protein